MKNKILLILIFCCLIIPPCYADGGIPLWVMSTPTLMAFGLADGITGIINTFVQSMVLLLFVAFVETIVVSFTLRKTRLVSNFQFDKMFFIVYKANFVSTLIGFLVVIAPIPFEKEILNERLAYIIVGPWGKGFLYSILGLNIILFAVSFLVEYLTAKKDLIKDYCAGDIKKSFLFANIITYAIPIIIYTIACISFLTFDIKSREYEKINIDNIDNIEVAKTAFIPTPLTKKEC